MEKFTNIHHVWHERRWYDTPLERRLRRHRGFVLPMDLYAHSELHANINAPDKPNPQQTTELLNTVGDFQLGRGRLYIVYHAIEAFNIWARSSNEQMAENAQAIADNLEAQTAYINFREPETIRRIA